MVNGKEFTVDGVFSVPRREAGTGRRLHKANESSGLHLEERAVTLHGAGYGGSLVDLQRG